jgi:hypothetical protein
VAEVVAALDIAGVNVAMVVWEEQDASTTIPIHKTRKARLIGMP